MIGYVTVGTNDFAKAAPFYDGVLGVLGAKRLMDFDDAYIAWGTSMDQPMVSIIKPYNKEPATVGNGVMVSLQCPSKEVVDQVHAKALELGGQDEGAAGPRGETFYAGYFRDLDGNKFNAFCITQAG